MGSVWQRRDIQCYQFVLSPGIFQRGFQPHGQVASAGVDSLGKVLRRGPPHHSGGAIDHQTDRLRIDLVPGFCNCLSIFLG